MDYQHLPPSAAFARGSSSKARATVLVTVPGFGPRPERECVEVLSLCRTDGAYRSARTCSSKGKSFTRRTLSVMGQNSTSGRPPAGRRGRGDAGAWRLPFLPDLRHPGGWLPEAILALISTIFIVLVAWTIYGGSSR